MSHLRVILPALTACLFAAGPLHADTGSGSDQENGQEQAMEPEKSMEKQWNETMDALGKFSAEQRDQALQSGRESLDVMDQRIERMQAWTSKHWESLSEEAREKKTQTLNAMREQRQNVAEWYGGMKHSSAETWDSVKEGFIQSYDKLQGYYRNAMESFGSDEEGSDSGS